MLVKGTMKNGEHIKYKMGHIDEDVGNIKSSTGYIKSKMGRNQ